MTAQPLDPLAPLPAHSLALEASAGTGKTFALTTLATRLIAEEGITASQLLLVTFTRSAAGELRERWRQRLTATLLSLEAGGRDEGDELVRHLRDLDPGVVRPRLARAVRDVDAATVTTIHGFCQQVLVGAGTTGVHDDDARLAEDITDLIEAAAADVLVDEALGSGSQIDDGKPPNIDKLIGWAGRAVADPRLHVLPDAPGPTEVPETERSKKEREAVLRARMVRRIRDQVRDELARRHMVDFDGLVHRVRDLVAADAALVARLRDRFRVAMVDELQDTDPAQWDIFSTVFGSSRLVIVGDPKQAIYAFRGGDVHTYLKAVDSSSDRRTLATSWRADGCLVEALNHLLGDTTFGDERIVYSPIEAADPLRERRCLGTGDEPLPPVRLRAVVDDDLASKNGKDVISDAARSVIRRDLAACLVEVLEDARLPDRSGGHRGARPADVAVLVRGNAEAEPLQAELRRAGIPAVIASATNVALTDAALHWRLLLDALARPHDVTAARTAAVTWFVGWSPAELAAADDLHLEGLQRDLRDTGDQLRARGAAALAQSLLRQGTVERLLSREGGERDLTDVEHLADLMVAATDGRPTSPTALLELLDALARRARAGDEEGLGPDAQQRRIESDADAVRIMTLHAAKGLEFPVVCLPSCWAAGNLREVVTVEPDGSRALQVGEDAARKAQAQTDQEGERRRLSYVGLTRASHLVLAWYAPVQRHANGGLDALLFGEGVTLTRSEVLDALRERAEGSGGLVEVAEVPATVGRRHWSGPADDGEPSPPTELAVATLGHDIDRSARSWSFTGITRVERPSVVAIDPHDESGGDAGAGDEGDADLDAPAEAADDASNGDEVAHGAELPMAALPGGAAFGTMVHEVLERADLAADDPEAELRRALGEVPRRTERPVDDDALVAALRAVLTTPLGEPFGQLRLDELERSDRLDELRFELALAPGGVPTTAAGLGALIADHLPTGDPLRPWATDVAAGRFPGELRGWLSGSIDLVLRRRGDDGRPVFHVVDYKTNWLGGTGELRLDDYRHDRLPAAMAHHHYPLQALLYAVALHRYLRWRLPDHDPDRDLGAVGYLFLRGMVGPDTPEVDGRRCGVFAWDLPPGLVGSASALLHGEDR